MKQLNVFAREPLLRKYIETISSSTVQECLDSGLKGKELREKIRAEALRRLNGENRK